MKRDLELCRRILLRVETLTGCEEDGPVLNDDGELIVEGSDAESTAYNVNLLVHAGLLTMDPHAAPSSFDIGTPTLTWAGHDYLEAVRDPEVWSKTKSGAAKLGSWTFDIVKDIAVGYVKQKANELGLPL